MYDVVLKRSRSLSHLLISSCLTVDTVKRVEVRHRGKISSKSLEPRDALSGRHSTQPGASAYKIIIHNIPTHNDEQGYNPGHEKRVRRCPLAL